MADKSVYEQWLEEREYHGPDLLTREETSRQLRGLAAPGTRLLAVLVDVGVNMAVMIPGFGLMIAGMAFHAGQNETGGLLFLAGYALALFASLALGIYNLVLLWLQGQTVGKRAMHIRIVRLDGSPAGFGRAVLLRTFIPGLLTVLTGGVFGIVDCCFIFREDRRCIHDLIAGTKVVRV